ncbi:hypothetical protein CYMTET_32678, partial [Cymbomonas tetramitiformis]
KKATEQPSDVKQLREASNAKSASVYTVVYPSKMRDVFAKEGIKDEQAQADELAGLKSTLETHQLLLKQTFRYYSCISGKNAMTMTGPEFNKLVKDCNLIDQDMSKAKVKLTAAAVDIIFQQANKDPEETGGEDDGADDAGTANNPDREFVPEEFTEALIRIAAVKFKDSHKTLAGRLEALILGPMSSEAGRCDTSIFRAMVGLPETQAVLQKHGGHLELIFAHYAAEEGIVGMGTMSISEYKAFLKDCKIFNDTFNDTAMNVIFGNVLDARGGGGGDDEPELGFGEFLEAVAAIVQYRMCNPYQPFPQRLDNFITRNIIPHAKAAKAQIKKAPSKKGNQVKDAAKKAAAALNIAGTKSKETFMETGSAALEGLMPGS